MSKGSKWYTAGYWYKFSAHAVLCHGPVDAITRILAGERTAWTGNVTANTTLDIEQTDLFGGQDAEGGWRGKIDVMMGEDDQAINACIAANRPATAAAYQGVTSLVFRGKAEEVVTSVWVWLGGGTSPFKQYTTTLPADSLTDGFWWTANAQSPKPFWTEVKHILKGRPWYTAKAAIGAYDMNPAHMIYTVLTNAQYALGRPSSEIDDAVFRAAADTLHAEGFGLSLPWYDNTTGEDFIHLILNHINAVLYTDPATGKWVLKLARGGYDVGSLPVIDASNATLESFDRAGWGEITNTLTVSYMNRSTAKEASLTVHNPAAISAQGGQIIASSKSYMGIHDDALAARVAQRDLLSTSTPLATCMLICNREMAFLRPGDVFKLTWAPLGIDSLVMRVGAIDYGTLTDGKIRITAGEDVFGMQATSYVASQPSQWTDPMSAPVAAAHVKAVELPYWEVNRNMTASAITDLDPDFGLSAVYITPTGLVDDVVVYASGTSGGVYAKVLDGGLVTTATLGADIGVGELTTGVVIDNLKNPEPMADSEYGYLDDECVLITAYDVGTNTYTLRRGLLDTVPAVHTAGARFYFGVDGMNFDETERLLTEDTFYKAAPKNTYGELALGAITPVSVTMANRYQRPYAPGKLRINGAAYPTAITGPLVVAWAHRDRTLQTAYVVTQDEANIGPEAGTTYTVKVYGDAGTLIHTESGITTATWTYTTEGGGHPYWSNLLSLLHFDGTNGSTVITDSKANTWTASGNAQISTAQSKFGGASLLLDGAGDYVHCSSNLRVGTGRFTIKAFVRPTSVAAFPTIFCARSVGGNSGITLRIDNTGKLNFFYGNGLGAITGTITIATNVQTHVAVTRDASNVVKLWVNGVMCGSATNTADLDAFSALPAVGANVEQAAEYFSGHIDEFEILTTDIYTADFTPETAASLDFGSAGGYQSQLRVTVEAVRGGLTSWQKHDHTFDRAGLGLSLGKYLGGV